MKLFSDLLPTEPWSRDRNEAQTIPSQFRDVAAHSRFQLWSPGMPVAKSPKRILIGVADYSVPDLRLLDLVNEVLVQRNGADVAWEVFNTMECQRMEDFEQYVPGLGNVYQTPVVGIWENGVLTERAWGKPARDLIIKSAGLGPEAEKKLFATSSGPTA